MAWRRNLPLLFLAGMSLASSGCLLVAAGAAGAGAVTYFYVRGKLCQEYHAPFPDTWQAVITVLQKQEFPIVHQENSGAEGTITSRTADGSAITVLLSTQASRVPVEKSVTRVCIRIGAWGDEPLSARLLSDIGAHLVPQGLVPRSPAVSSVPAGSTIKQASWSEPRETAPPPELPAGPASGPR